MFYNIYIACMVVLLQEKLCSSCMGDPDWQLLLLLQLAEGVQQLVDVRARTSGVALSFIV